jgi:hypothetical protein
MTTYGGATQTCIRRSDHQIFLSMKVIFALVAAFWGSITAFLTAQNLVVNPSFEQLKPDAVVVPCEFMQYSQFFTQNIQTWTSMRDMTPDLLRAAENCPWLTQAHSGEYCAGVVCYLPGLDIGQPND